MTTVSNRFFDTYIKTKSTTGALSGYTLQVDGNTFFNGNINLGNETSTTTAVVTTYTDTNGNITFKLNGVLYTISPTILKYLVNISSDIQTQMTTANSNITTNTTSIGVLNTQMTTTNTNITSLQQILTGCTYDSVYQYLNMTNNFHCYGTMQLYGLSNDLSTTINNIYSNLTTINTNTTNLTYSTNNNNFSGSISVNNNILLFQSSISDISYPILQISSDGQGSFSQCIINFDTWNGRTLGATQIIALDNNNYSSDLIFKTSSPRAVNSSSER